MKVIDFKFLNNIKMYEYFDYIFIMNSISTGWGILVSFNFLENLRFKKKPIHLKILDKVLVMLIIGDSVGFLLEPFLGILFEFQLTWQLERRGNGQDLAGQPQEPEEQGLQTEEAQQPAHRGDSPGDSTWPRLLEGCVFRTPTSAAASHHWRLGLLIVIAVGFAARKWLQSVTSSLEECGVYNV